MSDAVYRLLNTANAQVGYKAGSGKRNKYAKELDKYGMVYNYPKDGFDWCDIFVDWCFISTFGIVKGIKMIYQPQKSTGAGCEFSAQFYRNNKAFSKTPSIGSQIFFGTAGKETHTGIVVKVTDYYVYTVEGNTGGGNGAVQQKKYTKNNSKIVGYGIPNWGLINENDGNPYCIYTETAKEVIAGKWGNGAERKKALEEAGFDYNKIQNIVNQMLSKKSDKDIAYEVIKGLWGFGLDRKLRLEKAGYDYTAIQKLVNNILGY